MSKIKLITLIFLLNVIVSGLTPLTLHAKALLAVGFESADKLTRLTLDTSAKTTFVRPYSFDHSPRMIIDVQGLSAIPEAIKGIGAGAVDSYKIARVGDDKIRILLTLNTLIEFARLLEVPAVDGDAISYLLDFRPISQPLYQQNVIKDRERLAKLAAAQTPNSTPPTTLVRLRPLVVIDPGHGGKDSGASIKGQLPEKDLVLAFSLELKRKLLATQKVDVLLTREDDSFIDLKSRIGLARRYQADLFLSIHIDQNKNRNVFGASVYTLSNKASDALTQTTVDRENQHYTLADDSFSFNENSHINEFLYDLMKRETQAFSENFADLFLIALQSASKLLKNPKRSARFHILTAPDVPSVLIELGFISNKQDAHNLSSKSWRTNMTEAMTVAILDYFARKQAP